jgi:hypothetical protein
VFSRSRNEDGMGGNMRQGPQSFHTVDAPICPSTASQVGNKKNVTPADVAARITA